MYMKRKDLDKPQNITKNNCDCFIGFISGEGVNKSTLDCQLPTTKVVGLSKTNQ